MLIRRYEGKTAVVTGAANGIGACMVRRLLEEGAEVAALDIDEAGLERLYAGNGKVLYIRCDASKKADIDAAVSETVSRFGKIDVLFSNAGIIGRKSLLDTTEEDWRRVIDINLTGTFLMDQAVLRVMVEKGIKGAVVNTSSIAASVVSVNTGAYAASKGGVSLLTKFAALEMAPHGIRVNAIGPGASATRITEATRFNEERNRMFLGNIPMGRYGEP
ncbi:MAG: SDR family oxidoreductase [Mailhella sp.]|nr:SDR family oxidoreductase [Mailhella sp.]